MGSGRLVAVVAAWCPLRSPFPTTTASSKFVGPIYSFLPDVEKDIRCAPAQIGSTLNEHFSAFAHSSWRAWKLDKDA
eukprot:9073623-Pyramimonas_sp.AAC.1